MGVILVLYLQADEFLLFLPVKYLGALSDTCSASLCAKDETSRAIQILESLHYTYIPLLINISIIQKMHHKKIIHKICDIMAC
jgi:hypothetical protein